MKRSVYILLCILCLLSCNKKINTDSDNRNKNTRVLENNYTTKNEQIFYPEHFSNIDELLNDYLLDLGHEEYYRINNKNVEKYFNDEWTHTDDCSYSINENGFLSLYIKSKEYIFINNNICDAIDYEYQHANYILNDRRLISIISDGYFTEILNDEIVEYKVENLIKSVMSGFEIGENPIYTNHIPFVTKRGNSGIGEIIEVKCRKPQNSISILPGYVDTNRQDLFPKNNRLKNIKITDLDSTYCIYAEFSDIAVFQKIPFSKQIKNISIEILDVYKGSKYDDTCISGILIK